MKASREGPNGPGHRPGARADMTVTEFLVVNVRVESAFGMWHDEVFEVKYPALDRLTDSGMTDIERDAGLSFSNQFFRKAAACSTSRRQGSPDKGARRVLAHS